VKNKVYYLSTCDTCKRILKDVQADKQVFEYQDIKTEPVSADQREELVRITGSYESLINKRAQLFRERQIDPNGLPEKEYRRLLLEHYTFLKRPVVLFNGRLFAGNEKKTVAELRTEIAGY
jgi:arsenate reductase